MFCELHLKIKMKRKSPEHPAGCWGSAGPLPSWAVCPGARTTRGLPKTPENQSLNLQLHPQGQRPCAQRSDGLARYPSVPPPSSGHSRATGWPGAHVGKEAASLRQPTSGVHPACPRLPGDMGETRLERGRPPSAQPSRPPLDQGQRFQLLHPRRLNSLRGVARGGLGCTEGSPLRGFADPNRRGSRHACQLPPDTERELPSYPRPFPAASPPRSAHAHRPKETAASQENPIAGGVGAADASRPRPRSEPAA